MKGLAKALCLTLGVAAGSAYAADRSMQPIASDPVETSSGRVAGTALASGVKAYLGVPFAQAPVGDLRWAPPQPAHWSGIFNADRKGPACIQVLRPHDINHYFGEEATGEDCLSLNLWAPASAKAGDKLPVVVFLYGGGFTIGSSGMANYDGAAMAQAGAVFVNFNYRVGALGFLAHPELTKEQGGALWADGSDLGVAMGAGQCRQVWRRPGQGGDYGPIGGRGVGRGAGLGPGGARVVSRGGDVVGMQSAWCQADFGRGGKDRSGDARQAGRA